MKKLLAALLATFFLFFLFYLAGCFYNRSFNLNCWNEISLSMVSLFGTVFSLFLGAFTFVETKE